jgi:hypothetical protein
MKDNKTTDLLTEQIFNSTKSKKLAKVLVLAGIIICIIPLLPPVQRLLFSFVDAGTSGVNLRTSNTFDSRLISLLSLPFFGLVIFIFSFCCLYSKTIAMFLQEEKNAKLINIFTAGIVVLVLCFISFFSYRYGRQWLNSDHSSEMVLGKLLADENAFVSSNWRYSTEIRLIYQTIFTMPLFKLFAGYENWALIRSLNILLNNLIYILSYFFMAKQMKIHIKYILFTIIFLIIPFSTGYWDIVLFGAYYIFFIAQLFCCLGLYIRLANITDATKKMLPWFILFSILSFLLGVQGIRSLFCFHLPMLITCILIYSRTTQKRLFPLFMGCYGFVLCCVGFAVNFLLHFKYSFYSFDVMRLENLSDNFILKLGQSLVCLPEFFGFSNGDSLLSARGLFSIAVIIGTIILFWAVLKLLGRQRLGNNVTDIPLEHQFLSLFFLISVIFNIFVFIIVDEKITPRYFMPFLILCIPLIAIFFEYAEKVYGHLKRVAIISGISLLLLGQCYLNFQSMATQDINSGRKGYIQYLLDNQLNFGFATFWNANVTTELTSGRIEFLGLDTEINQLKILGWLNPVAFYDPAYYKGESFLLLTRAEWELLQTSEYPFTQFHPDYEDLNFVIKRYPSAEIIHRDVIKEGN